MDATWEMIEPYVLRAVELILGTILIWLTAKGTMARSGNALLSRMADNYNAKLIGREAANALAGKTVNIDVTAVTEKALTKTTKALDARIDKVVETVNALTPILVGVAKGVMTLKNMPESDKAKLAEAIQILERGYTPPEDDTPMTVLLQPVELAVSPADTDTDADGDSDCGVNFGDLRG